MCGESGHSSGFVGATYIDCINKPCYICNERSHSTQLCPHRRHPELSCVPESGVSLNKGGLVQNVMDRERGLKSLWSLPPHPPTYEIDAAVLKLHARRTTCLEFHPTNPRVVLSGDKAGQVAVWDIDRVFERSVYTEINKWLTNNIKWMKNSENMDHFVTSGYEGTVKIFDAEIGVSIRTLLSINPQGWERVEEEDKAGRWRSCIGLATHGDGSVVAGDSKGMMYLLDPRMEGIVCAMQAHRAGTKIQSIDISPTASHIILSAGNDYSARFLDIRKLHATKITTPSKRDDGRLTDAELTYFEHPRVINHAVFSPLTGKKVVTTCQDNRIRVWDDWMGSALLDGNPDREIVHSHTFNRHLSAFKAELDPKDPSERLAVIGRYISEDFGGFALHPIDLIDTSTGRIVGEMVDPNLTTISPVNKFHPSRDCIITGSSRSLYVWRPVGVEDADRSIQVGSKSADAPDNRSNAPKGSSHYVCFDAEDTKRKKKKKQQSHMEEY